MESYKKKVEKIASEVRAFYDSKQPFRISHGSTNSTRPSLFRKGNVVDTSALCHVLKVNIDARTVLVESNVSMDRLVETTLKYGLVPPVVMEFPGITVGGGYAGTAGESSSFKHGFFNCTINYVEMVLANGDVVKASETERSDLFTGAAGAVGSLGIVTAVELRLIEATKYVEASFYPVTSVPEATKNLQEWSKNPNLDYIDGILFSINHGVIVTGHMTNETQLDLPVSRFSKSGDPWFYSYAKELASKASSTSPARALIPLDEYLFRYDRGGFWVGHSLFDYFGLPCNRITRWLFDDYSHTRTLYAALHAVGFASSYVVQDLALPYSTVDNFIEYTDKEFGIYPLWLCPLRQDCLETFHPHFPKRETDGGLKPMLNVGLWGPFCPEEFEKANRELEVVLQKLGGMKWLYANTYYSESAFWEIYDRKWYDTLRAKYDATSLPSVYQKVHTNVEAQIKTVDRSWWLRFLSLWPVSGIWGLYAARTSGNIALAQKSKWKSIESKDE